MSAGKRPYIRFRIINKCLTSRVQKYWTKQELLEVILEFDINITDRTLENDFRAMREDSQLGFYAPIVYCWRNKGFHYSDPDYSIEKLCLIKLVIGRYEGQKY